VQVHRRLNPRVSAVDPTLAFRDVQLLKLKHDKLLSNFALDYSNLRPSTSVEESLKHPTADIRNAAVAAIGQFAAAYMVGANPQMGAKRLVVKLADALRADPNPAARRGGALQVDPGWKQFTPRLLSCVETIM